MNSNSKITLKLDEMDPNSPSIELSEKAIDGLQDFANEVLRLMREQDQEYADCWQCAYITFNDLVPSIRYGGSWEECVSAGEVCILTGLY